MSTGRIEKALSGVYYVNVGGVLRTCRARGKFRRAGMSPLVGDWVEVLELDSGEGMVEKILERKNVFFRPAAANIDQLVIFASAAIPVTDPYLIDRVSAIARLKGCEVLVCLNKCDHGRRSAFTGNSGVGKSGVLNALDPALALPVGEVSKALGRGRHTTRHVELFSLGEDTYVIDTPGFSSFDTQELDLELKAHLPETFPEFAPYVDDCRFVGCSHTKEKGCAVLQALREGKFPKSRHESYVRLYNELKDLREWDKK